jgi:DNA-binding XRE family transcriptional regulator
VTDRNVATFTIEKGLKLPHGRKKADEVVIPMTDFEALIEAIEDRIDIAECRAIMARLKPEDLIPIEVTEARIKGESMLRAWRKDRGLTLKQLAEKSGLSVPYLSQLENGQKEPTIDTIKKLARAFKTDPGNLI